MFTKDERDELRSSVNFEVSDGKWRMHRLALKNGLTACLKDLDTKDAELAKLKMYADWDQNWCHCEACQRWTRPEDMRHGDTGSCCLWCLVLDTKNDEIKTLTARVAQLEAACVFSRNAIIAEKHCYQEEGGIVPRVLTAAIEKLKVLDD